jgi:hypothetical protein
MTRLEDRQILVRDIEQACAGGARLAPACALAGIDARTLRRPLCQTSCRLNRIGTLGARIAESGSIRTSVQRSDSGEAVAAGEFGDRLGVA